MMILFIILLKNAPVLSSYTKKKDVRICKSLNTIEWDCIYSSLREQIGRVKHLYVFPDKYEDDYCIFNTCPV